MQLETWIAMIDSALCPTGTAGRWAEFTKNLLDELTKTDIVLPMILSLILLPWFVRSIPWKRQISSTGVVLLLLYMFVASPMGIKVGNKLLVSLLPSDSGQAADAIVVLGRGPDLRPQRIQVATELWQAKRAPLVFVSGWGDAEPMTKMLSNQGVSPQAIDGEPCSRTTEENALFTAAQLQPRGVRQILLVTDPPHMLRSYLTFRSLGFEVLPHPNPLPAQLRENQRAFILVREYFGLASYSVLGRFLPRESSIAPVAAAIPASAHAALSSSEPVDSNDSLEFAYEPAKSSVSDIEQSPG